MGLLDDENKRLAQLRDDLCTIGWHTPGHSKRPSRTVTDKKGNVARVAVDDMPQADQEPSSMKTSSPASGVRPIFENQDTTNTRPRRLSAANGESEVYKCVSHKHTAPVAQRAQSSPRFPNLDTTFETTPTLPQRPLISPLTPPALESTGDAFDIPTSMRCRTKATYLFHHDFHFRALVTDCIYIR